MIAAADTQGSGAQHVASLSAGERGRWFYPKSDIDLDDTRLRALRREAAETLKRRTPAVERLADELGLGRGAEPLTSGTFHVVHAAGAPERRHVVRSTLAGLFTQDRSLLIERVARRWLGPSGHLVPAAKLVRFGAPFDFAVLERSAHPTLRNLGDAALDEDPQWLVAIGQALRALHGCAGEAAGLLDLDAVDGAAAPVGVHASWPDYLSFNLPDHVAVCESAGLIAREQSRDILALMRRAAPLLEHRPMRLLHGDLGAHNLCVDIERRRPVHVIDWEDALVGDPLFDVAMALTFQPPRRHSPILAGYGLSEPTQDEQRLLTLYFLRIAVSKTVHRIRFGVEDLPGREPAHLRIHRALGDLARLV